MSAGRTDIGQERAVEIARGAIAGKVTLTSTASLRVERKGATYVVTWERHDPPGTRGPDFDARVTIDAQTGAVLELLGGS